MTRPSKLSRRTFLGGAAAALALPWLESLHGRAARAAGPDDGPPRRLLFYYVPNGIHMADWTPTQTGAGYDLPPILKPLGAMQDKVLVLTGLANLPAKPDGAGDHAAGTGSFLTCTHVFKTEGKDIKNGVSVDQVAANAIGGATNFPSLQLGVDGGGNVGGCDSGYSCAYARNISWAGPATPLPKLVNPQLVFDRLFAGYDPLASAEQLDRRRRYRLSILDWVTKDAKTLQSKLAPLDKLKVQEYLDSVRALELRLEAGEVGGLTCDPGPRPEDEGDVQARVALMTDLMVLALQCDQTRVVSFMLGNAGSGRSYDFLGVSGAHHELSHHQNQPENFDKLRIIDTWEVTVFAQLLAKMDAVVEADGTTLLDNSLVFFSSEIEDGNAHRHTNLPVLLAGGGGGAVTPGRHVVYGGAPPIANLFLSMLHAVGVDAAAFGDSTGPLPNLV